MFFMQYLCSDYIVGNQAKGWISKRVFQENRARQIFRKTNISYPLIRTRTCAYQGVRNVLFSENLACFVFLKHPFWDLRFCLITDDMMGSEEHTSLLPLLKALWRGLKDESKIVSKNETVATIWYFVNVPASFIFRQVTDVLFKGSFIQKEECCWGQADKEMGGLRQLYCQKMNTTD